MRSLKQPYTNFISNLERIRVRGVDVEAELVQLKPWRLRYLTEGLISDLWQSWNHFTRTVLTMSCQGCVNRTSILISKRSCNNSWKRIGYEAKQAAVNTKVHPSRTIRYKKHEPTWGDTDKVIDIITGLSSSNKDKLISAFGLPLRGPKHLQIVRNACAHKNDETMATVRNISIYYISKPLQQPCELTWQIDKRNNTTALYSWITDFKHVAELATL